MFRFIGLGTVCLMLIGLAGPAVALDGTRKGFILGGGLGFGSSKWTIDASQLFGGSEESKTKSGLSTDFKIGGGITEQFLLYWHNRVNWTSQSAVGGGDITVVFGNSGLGAAYYFTPAAPAGYLMGQVGFMSIAAPFESNTSSDSGAGFLVGGGYEFSPHWSVEGFFGYGSPDTGIGSVDQSVRSFGVSFNGLWY